MGEEKSQITKYKSQDEAGAVRDCFESTNAEAIKERRLAIAVKIARESAKLEVHGIASEARREYLKSAAFAGVASTAIAHRRSLG
ncbi:MAG TPA: hypothetical protein VGH65_03915 [Verrucomicrobiaceae bacterium]